MRGSSAQMLEFRASDLGALCTFGFRVWFRVKGSGVNQ